MIDFAGIPSYLVRDIQAEINRNPTVIKWREAQRKYQASGKYLEAIKIARMLDEVEEKVKEGMLMRSTTMGKLYDGMAPEDVERINVACNSIILMSDLIETQVMEMNEVVKKYHPEYKVEMYDRFIQVGKEAKEQLAFMSKWSNNLYQIKFGDVADNMMDMVKSKVRKLLRQSKQ